MLIPILSYTHKSYSNNTPSHIKHNIFIIIIIIIIIITKYKKTILNTTNSNGNKYYNLNFNI